MTQTFKHAVIACHPEEHSFTLSMARRYAETVEASGHHAVLRDLYRMKFNPILGADERKGVPAADVAQELAVLGKVDVFVLVYPIWFGTPPAMLKGYIDRVFGAGRSRGRSEPGGPGELLAGKRLVSLSASGSMRAWLSEKGVLGSLRTVYDRYFADVFGFEETHRFHFDGIVEDLPERDVSMFLYEVEKAAREVMSRMVLAPPERHPHPPR